MLIKIFNVIYVAVSVFLLDSSTAVVKTPQSLQIGSMFDGLVYAGFARFCD